MAEDRGLLRGNAALLILVVLKDGARHGYDIAREVERRTAEELTFKHGTLYPVLHAMEKEGMIVSAWSHVAGERPRRVYQITENGLAELENSLKSWEAFSRAVNSVIRGRPDEQIAFGSRLVPADV